MKYEFSRWRSWGGFPEKALFPLRWKFLLEKKKVWGGSKEKKCKKTTQVSGMMWAKVSKRKQLSKTLEMREGLGAQNWDDEVLGVSRPGLRGQEYELMDHQWAFPVLILWEAFSGFYLCIYLSHFRVPRTVAADGICSVKITPFMSSILASLLRRPVWLCDMRPSLH